MNENSVVMYLVVNKSLNLTAGKISAQVGHLVELISQTSFQLEVEENDNFATYSDEELTTVQNKIGTYQKYKTTGTTKIVLGCSDLSIWAELKRLTPYLVIDEGRTECPPNSETVLGFFPMRKSEAPDVIKKMRLL